MPAISRFPTPESQDSVAPNFVQKARLALQRFNDDEQGMNTVEAIILLFVAAIVLLVFFAVIWPLIRESVMEQLNSLFGQRGT
jgi:Flp pilus assembly pilin Flp